MAQTYVDHEVIVMDDGSTDETRDVIAQFGSRVRYFYQPNRGLSSARNSGLSQAGGELVAYLDADDMWYPQKLNRQVSFLDAHQEYGLVHSDVTLIDETDQVIHLRRNHQSDRKIQQGYCNEDLLRWNYILPTAVVERRTCMGDSPAFDERITAGEDRLRWISLAMDGFPFGYIDEPLAMQRRRSGSLSRTQRRMCEGLLMVFEILLTEKHLRLRWGRKAAHLARDEVYKLQLELAYLDRTEGKIEDARRRLRRLMLEYPLQRKLYVELLKAHMPLPLATRLRELFTVAENSEAQGSKSLAQRAKTPTPEDFQSA